MSDNAPEYEYVQPTYVRTSLRPTELASTFGRLDTQTLKACLEITTSYRTGKRSKSSALRALQSTIASANLDEGTYESSLSAYTRIIDDVERHVEEAVERGQARPSHVRHENQTVDDRGKYPRTGPDSPRSDAGQSTLSQSTTAPIPAPPAIASRLSKRPRSISAGSDEDRSTRPKIDLKSLPWVVQDEAELVNLSQSLRKTLATLENISRDPKLAKSSLLNSARCPQFPDSEWSNLLAGRAVDLDHVLGGIYTISHDEKRTEKMGNVELTFGATKPAKTVDTHGKWVIAWNQAVEATKYIFPHRAAELRQYGKHLTNLFAAYPESHHTRLIQYDRAVRIRAAQRRDLELTDYARFADLHTLWVQSAGGGSTQEKPKPVFKRRDPCRRWNEGRCPNGAASCTYGHVCSHCRSNAHTAANCTVTRK